MKASIVDTHVVLTAVYKVDGGLILETNCSSFDEYAKLPGVIEWQGVLCGKTGWSSDKNYACYKSSAIFGKTK